MKGFASGTLSTLILLAMMTGIATAESNTDLEARDSDSAQDHKLEYLVPELAGHSLHLDPGPRRFEHRLSVSPAYGSFGSEPFFVLRITYNPNSWLGYEGSIGHNPGKAVHAVLHSVSLIVRRPLPGRFQPYVKGGYGMIMVSPGPSLNADPVTRNALTIGGGMEFYIRNDLAIRLESQLATVLGSERGREGIVAFNYQVNTIGFAFYRTIGP